MVRKTKTGWVVEITSTRYGCLEQGGVCGREVLYKTETLNEHGINYDDDPDELDAGTSTKEWLLGNINPDKVLKAGHIIR